MAMYQYDAIATHSENKNYSSSLLDKSSIMKVLQSPLERIISRETLLLTIPNVPTRTVRPEKT